MITYAQDRYATRRATGRATDRFLRVRLGSLNPIGCLVSVIDNPAAAARATTTLRVLGFRDEHIRVIPAAVLLASTEDSGRRRGLLARAACMLIDWSDNAAFTEEYLDEARRGHHLLMVYAPSLEHAQRAHAAARAHGARLARHYGLWVVRGLDA